jgi:hypothetical protein
VELALLRKVSLAVTVFHHLLVVGLQVVAVAVRVLWVVLHLVLERQ